MAEEKDQDVIGMKWIKFSKNIVRGFQGA